MSSQQSYLYSKTVQEIMAAEDAAVFAALNSIALDPAIWNGHRFHRLKFDDGKTREVMICQSCGLRIRIKKKLQRNQSRCPLAICSDVHDS